MYIFIKIITPFILKIIYKNFILGGFRWFGEIKWVLADNE